jgi:hypothetical protein
MAAKIDAEMTFDDMESEILYTCAALEADPDAKDLFSLTDTWMPKLDDARTADRNARAAEARASAQRRVANGRLDAACQRFGDELLLEVKKDTAGARWRTFFTGTSATIHTFIRLAFGEQIARVGAWLRVSGDAVLDRHREPLATWSAAGQNALSETQGTATVRGQARVVREQLAEDLTRARDGLEATLVERGQEKGLQRDWPSLFFRTRPRRSRDTDPQVDAPL